MLAVTVLQGQFTRDTDTVSKMDPYVILAVGTEIKKTKVANGQGKAPVWKEVLTFSQKGNLLKVTVKDEDVTSDDLVGEGTFDIQGAYTHPNAPRTFPIEVFYDNKPAGKVMVTVQFKTV